MNGNKGCPGCTKKGKTQSNSSGGKGGGMGKGKMKRKMKRVFEKQEAKKNASSMPSYKNGGSVLGFDPNNLKTSSFKKLK
jgi:hypothetical protein